MKPTKQPRWQIESPTRGVYVGSTYAHRARNWPIFTHLPSSEASITFDWDSLSQEEAEAVEAIAERLGSVHWARQMVDALACAGGVRRENKALMFELRFADAIASVGIELHYEIPGEGDSTIDFGFESAGLSWAVELMRLEETEAVQAASNTERDENGVVWSGRVLSDARNDDDKRLRTEGGETLKAVERICQKCERNGHPYKFRKPDGQFNVLLVDMRTFLHGGDEADRLHIALGAQAVPACLRQHFNGKPVTGVFDNATKLKGAKEARERIHFIGFVRERRYGLKEFAPSIQFVANPCLFANDEEARAVIASWPLQPIEIIEFGPDSTAGPMPHQVDNHH